MVRPAPKGCPILCRFLVLVISVHDIARDLVRFKELFPSVMPGKLKRCFKQLGVELFQLNAHGYIVVAHKHQAQRKHVGAFPG